MNRNLSHIGQTQSKNECRYPTTLQEDPQGITEVDSQETPQQERDDNSRRTQAEAHKDQPSTQSKATRDQDSTDKGNDKTKDKTHKDTNATNVRPDRLLLDHQETTSQPAQPTKANKDQPSTQSKATRDQDSTDNGNYRAKEDSQRHQRNKRQTRLPINRSTRRQM